MQLPVHHLSHQVLRKHYGSATLQLDRYTAILPVLIVPPHIRRTHLAESIEISGHRDLISHVHPESGHTLYRWHMQQMMDWITIRVSLGQHAWPAMMEWYDVHEIDIAKCDPASHYRQWYRANERKRRNYLYKQDFDVLKKTSANSGDINAALETAAEHIHAHSEAFYTRNGQPDAGMIRKAIIRALHIDHGWSQINIAGVMGMTQQGVSWHLQSLSDPIQPSLS